MAIALGKKSYILLVLVCVATLGGLRLLHHPLGEPAVSRSVPAVSSSESAVSCSESAVSRSEPADPSGDVTTFSYTAAPPWDTIASVGEMYKRMGILTAFSSNHFKEAKAMIASFQKCFPNKTIVVYDLGLKPHHKTEVRSYCNVELRPFPFDEYAPHVRKLFKYSWKPIITKIMSQEYDVIMYGDSSLRTKSCDITEALAHLFKFPLLSAHPISHRAIEFTHDGMIKYLCYPPSRKSIADINSIEGSCWLMWANSIMREKLIEPWLDCALHQECMAPKGAVILPCRITEIHDGRYVNCHRYDQSALNLILLREFGLDAVKKASNTTISEPTWSIERYPSKEYKVSRCEA